MFGSDQDTSSIYGEIAHPITKSVAEGYNGEFRQRAPARHWPRPSQSVCGTPARPPGTAPRQRTCSWVASLAPLAARPAGTIFAYGQTAAGKTFTMQGSEEHPGIVRMAVDDIMEHIANVRPAVLAALRVPRPA